MTSLATSDAKTQQIIHRYKTRMQIEEGFRDIKISRWGLAFNEAHCTTTYRYENLLLAAHLATLAVWMIGRIAESRVPPYWMIRPELFT